ncbi:hypothetical protein DERP_002049 [Dermatophagoides pteronyssinus]|uniref:Uncharacterized protein n=1 Tax=Dermatophagoides pteronyssinus TaxID=6956 RepID=A0ABQ8JGL8_DERPT|nr:hypothetical protein DERP_002049 [Dermatophagoides pteronyssinus]
MNEYCTKKKRKKTVQKPEIPYENSIIANNNDNLMFILIDFGPGLGIWMWKNPYSMSNNNNHNC